MTIDFRGAAGINFCTEYVVREADTLQSIARVLLGDINHASMIKMKWDPSAKKQIPLNNAPIKKGDVLLLPPVQDSVKNKNITVRNLINDLDSRARAQGSKLTLEYYYEERKRYLAQLPK